MGSIAFVGALEFWVSGGEGHETFDDNLAVGKARCWNAFGAKDGERQRDTGEEERGTKEARQRSTILQNWR